MFLTSYNIELVDDLSMISTSELGHLSPTTHMYGTLFPENNRVK